ncbi:hypothetical protein LIER_23080 [Lithospermum erythrorhizon]|uniref:Uncharacterized protein n=1 Tax=Lithospermum erythrorhizon TaxID=34254 RepID=A0AAV3QZ75_LITER
MNEEFLILAKEVQNSRWKAYASRVEVIHAFEVLRPGGYCVNFFTGLRHFSISLQQRKQVEMELQADDGGKVPLADVLQQEETVCCALVLHS